ncbi:MAG: AraC family transcriptional regulator [Clostridia bacterium]|nr:AraC family transcriptional regulator [Clostridia bacterium]
MTESKLTIKGIRANGIHSDAKLRGSDFVMAGHDCHNFYELFYVESGVCRFFIDDSIQDLHSGTFILIPPMALHYTRYPQGSCKRIVTTFGSEDLSEETMGLMPQGGAFFTEKRVFQVPLAYQSQLISCLAQISAEEKIGDHRSTMMQKTCLQWLFILCSRVCIFLNDSPTDIHTTDPQIVHAARFIAEQYMNDITLQDIADAVGFSPNYLSRKFREATGIRLHEYLVFMRLNHAAMELVSTQDSIITIALRCGFSDSNYFKDCFKKKYGLTPREYRKLS